jgi:hypothetical protein
MLANKDPFRVGLQGNFLTFYGGAPTQAHILVAWSKSGARLCDDRVVCRERKCRFACAVMRERDVNGSVQGRRWLASPERGGPSRTCNCTRCGFQPILAPGLAIQRFGQKLRETKNGRNNP